MSNIKWLIGLVIVAAIAYFIYNEFTGVKDVLDENGNDGFYLRDAIEQTIDSSWLDHVPQAYKITVTSVDHLKWKTIDKSKQLYECNATIQGSYYANPSAVGDVVDFKVTRRLEVDKDKSSESYTVRLLADE